MRQFRASYVTLCQQLLVLLVVIAALTPAASVISLELFEKDAAEPERPTIKDTAAQISTTGDLPQVASAPTDSEITNYPLGADRRSRSGSATSGTFPADGYAGVGVTWSTGTQLADENLLLQVRSQHDGTWTGWQPLAFDAEHAPDPHTREGKGARPGTDLMFVGHADQIEVRAQGSLPSGLQVSVVTPGESAAARTKTAAPAASRSVTGAPAVLSRAQWGANEVLRDGSELRYFEVHAGFVHHTATTNDYTADEVPGIIRGIYAYHVRTRGWSDIGYNFLIDRFGRIWEGRYGGISRPVVGAHTLGYNDYAFAASAIGNYSTTKPSTAMLDAYGKLFAWKLWLHGVDPTTKTTLSGDPFATISGHRDAANTACPGSNLYAQLGVIRSKAAAAQTSWASRDRFSNLVGGAPAEFVARRASDGKAVVLSLDSSQRRVRARIETGLDISGANLLLQAGDWDRDGDGDLITRSAATGDLWLRPGDGNGRFATGRRLATGFAGVRLLASVGDMTGDGLPDLMGQPRGRGMRIYPGAGLNGFQTSYAAYSAITASRHLGIGLLDQDGAPDSLLRVGSKLVRYRGNGPGGLVNSKVTLTRDFSAYDLLTASGDPGGYNDLIARRRATGEWVRFSGIATGFSDPVVLGSGADRYDLMGL